MNARTMNATELLQKDAELGNVLDTMDHRCQDGCWMADRSFRTTGQLIADRREIRNELEQRRLESMTYGRYDA